MVKFSNQNRQKKNQLPKIKGGKAKVARWTKKSLTFSLNNTQAQVDFIDQLKRKLKLAFHIKADQRRITVTLRGDPEQVRIAVNRAQAIYRNYKDVS